MSPIPSHTQHEPRDQQLSRYDSDQIQKRFAEWINKLKTSCPIMDGVLLEGVSLSATAVDTPHKLSREWRGYIVMSLSAGETVFAARVSATSDASFIRLTATGAVTASIWVF